MTRCPRPRKTWDASLPPPLSAEVVHVYPLFGRQHEVDGEPCWCDPEHEPCGDGWLVIHNADN